MRHPGRRGRGVPRARHESGALRRRHPPCEGQGMGIQASSPSSFASFASSSYGSRLRRALRASSVLALVALAAACASSAPSASDTTAVDAQSCAPPAGLRCCNGDVVGRWTCDADGKTACQDGTRLVPASACTTPRGTSDAAACAPPSGFECCDGDVTGRWTCDADGGTACDPGTHLTPADQCTLPPPLDAGSDAPADARPE